jgi:hypothetical protein
MSLGRSGERRRVATVSENLRLQQVYATLVNFGGSELADRIGLPTGSRGGCSAHWIWHVPQPVPTRSSAAKTRIMLESLGPTYVKPGLIVSSQASALPDEWRVQLDRLQNEVPPVPYEAARQVITGELGGAAGGAVRGPSPRGRWPQPRAAIRVRAYLAARHLAVVLSGLTGTGSPARSPASLCRQDHPSPGDALRARRTDPGHARRSQPSAVDSRPTQGRGCCHEQYIGASIRLPT